jgi:hypothetical protein
MAAAFLAVDWLANQFYSRAFVCLDAVLREIGDMGGEELL